MKNIITFDLENWYDSEFVHEKGGPDFVLQGLSKAIKLLDKHGVKATFFVTGEVLEKYPSIIKNLAKRGHDVESHSYRHVLLTKLSKEDIKNEILKSKNLILKTTGKNPVGFRAPMWSVTKENFWIYEYLSSLNFKYSSSLFPINMGHYGSWIFPTKPFKPRKSNNFLEFPLTTFDLFGIRIPFSGGVYFRVIPKFIIKWLFKRMNKKGRFVMVYIHPWELCPNIPRVKTTFIGKIASYWGLNSTSDKLDTLLATFKFVPFKEFINDIDGTFSN